MDNVRILYELFKKEEEQIAHLKAIKVEIRKNVQNNLLEFVNRKIVRFSINRKALNRAVNG